MSDDPRPHATRIFFTPTQIHRLEAVGVLRPGQGNLATQITDAALSGWLTGYLCRRLARIDRLQTQLESMLDCPERGDRLRDELVRYYTSDDPRSPREACWTSRWIESCERRRTLLADLRERTVRALILCGRRLDGDEVQGSREDLFG